MFTGLIETTGVVGGFSRTPTGSQLEIQCEFAGQLSRGDSVAVDGVCLTAVVIGRAAFTADVSQETLARTTMGQYIRGRKVNLERPMGANGRMGGHFVLGHVDGIGRVLAMAPIGDGARIDIEVPVELAPLLVDKCSIAVDGISLTANEVRGASFWVALIPETLTRTCILDRKPGDAVNIEGDIIGKYVMRAMELRKGS